MLSPDYVTINQNFSPIPQISIPKASIMAKKDFWKISQFSRKIYIVCKIWTKMLMLRLESVTPDYVTINQNFNPISQIYGEELLKNFPVFQKKVTLCGKLVQKMVMLGFLSITP